MRALLVILLLSISTPAAAQTMDSNLICHMPSPVVDYSDAVQAMEVSRATCDKPTTGRVSLEKGFDELAKHWLGTTLGLGAPQTSTPQQGKINCGTFVGTVIRDLGFRLEVSKLQRQPASLIIKTFTPSKQIMRFRNRPMTEFVDKVAAAGDGVYIIGLDFHVGFLRVTNGEVRFVHASYVTGTVVDELATESEPITTSKLRVVGKIFDDSMVQKWSSQSPVAIRGNW